MECVWMLTCSIIAPNRTHADLLRRASPSSRQVQDISVEDLLGCDVGTFGGQGWHNVQPRPINIHILTVCPPVILCQQSAPVSTPWSSFTTHPQWSNQKTQCQIHLVGSQIPNCFDLKCGNHRSIWDRILQC